MVDRKAKRFVKHANDARRLNRLRGRMIRHGDVDCLLDYKLIKLSMERNCGDMGDDDVFDENYLTYLLDLEKSVKPEPVEEHEADLEYGMFLENSKQHGKSYKLDVVSVEHGVPTQEDVDDPHYSMFLENLKEWGNSYMLEVPVVHGVPLCIIYEEENVHEKKTVGEVMKKRKLMSDTCNHVRDERNLNVSHGEKSGAERSGSSKLITKPLKSDHFQGKRMREKNNPISVSFADFQDKKRKRTEVKNPFPLNPDDFKEDQCLNVQEKRTVGEVMKKRKLLSDSGNHVREERNLNVSHGKKSGGSSKLVTKSHSSDHFQGKRMTERKNPISVSFADFQDKKRTEVKNPFPLNPNDFKGDQSVNVTINSRSAPKNSSFQKSVVNEVYGLFLKNLKVIGESVVYRFGDNELVLYELSCKRHVTIVAGSGNHPIRSDPPIKNNLRTSIASESFDQSRRKIVTGLPLTVRVATEKQPTHPATTFIPASRSTMPLFDKQLHNPLEVSHRVPSNMRKKLLVILNRPYSEQEHEQLWKELSLRSAVRTHRDSRSGGTHRPGQMGRSLLDWHSDLSSEIDKVKSDPPKVLNLLRMLSYYIKKLPCGNICKPWMDDSLMTIIHESA